MKFVALFAFGGTEGQFVNLGLALQPSRFAVHFGCLRRWGQLLEQIDARGIPVYDYQVTSFRSWNALRAQLRLAQDIRRKGIQLVHTYNFYANVFAIPAAKLGGARVVASIRDMGAYLSPAQRTIQRYVCSFADQIVVNADAIRKWLVADGYAEDRITVIPNGIDLGRFEAIGRSGWLHAELGLPADAPLVGLLGRLAPLKGVEDFLSAAAVIASRSAEARFVIIGEAIAADYAAQLKRMAVQLGIAGRVVFTGYRADVQRILPELSISVQPSLSEGLSNTLLESMAAGVPVVATRVGGTPEAIDDGENGMLVPPRDPKAIANSVLQLLESPDLAKRIAVQARRSAQRYSMRDMVERTSRVYESLLQ